MLFSAQWSEGLCQNIFSPFIFSYWDIVQNISDWMKPFPLKMVHFKVKKIGFRLWVLWKYFMKLLIIVVKKPIFWADLKVVQIQADE